MDINTAQGSRKQPNRKLPQSVGKILLGSAIVFFSAGFSFDAEARGHGHHYYGDHHRGHGYRHGYNYGYRRGHRRHHGHHDRGAYLAGGLVLGSLLTHAYHRSHEPYVVRESRVVRRTVETPVSRRLFKDRYGDCFERNYNSAGDEVLVELNPSECAW